MDDKERVEIIRRGNELFNSGRINDAVKLFVKAKYRDGIMRVADHYYFDKKQPLLALNFYRIINRKDRMDEIFARMMFALNKLIKATPGQDKPGEATKEGADGNGDNEVEVKIHPKLRILAEEIIRKNRGEE